MLRIYIIFFSVCFCYSQQHYNFNTGNKQYELTNHLDNVLVTISDKKIQFSDNNTDLDYYKGDIITSNNYYPFGMTLEPLNTDYRYGFNGKEMDDEGNQTQYDYGFRIYSPRIGRFLSVDPLNKSYPELTPYQFASNKPINSIDWDGLEARDSNSSEQYSYKREWDGKRWRYYKSRGYKEYSGSNAERRDRFLDSYESAGGVGWFPISERTFNFATDNMRTYADGRMTVVSGLGNSVRTSNNLANGRNIWILFNTDNIPDMITVRDGAGNVVWSTGDISILPATATMLGIPFRAGFIRTGNISNPRNDIAIRNIGSSTIGPLSITVTPGPNPTTGTTEGASVWRYDIGTAGFSRPALDPNSAGRRVFNKERGKHKIRVVTHKQLQRKAKWRKRVQKIKDFFTKG